MEKEKERLGKKGRDERRGENARERGDIWWYLFPSKRLAAFGVPAAYFCFDTH